MRWMVMRENGSRWPRRGLQVVVRRSHEQVAGVRCQVRKGDQVTLKLGVVFSALGVPLSETLLNTFMN